MQSSPAFQQSPFAETSTAGDRVVVYHGATGNALVLNPTGSLLWRALSAGPVTEQLLIEKIAAQYPGESCEVIARDVAAFLEEIRAHQLIEARE
jgi:hypothetical protein